MPIGVFLRLFCNYLDFLLSIVKYKLIIKTNINIKKIAILCFLCAICMQLLAQEPALSPKEERAFLLKNVKEIKAMGALGEIVLFKENSFPVLVSPEDEKTVVAASSMGKGYAEGSAVEERLAALERGDDLTRQLDAGRAAVYGSTEDDSETHFIGWLDDVDPDALFASGDAWGLQIVRRKKS